MAEIKGMNPIFRQSREGFEVIDPIERKRYPIETAETVTPTAGNGGRIPYPIDSTAVIMTSGMTLPENPHIYVRNREGELLTEVQQGKETSLSKSEYILDLPGPLKIYAYIESALRIYVGEERTKLWFGNPTRITISARSFHRRPAKTISTTGDPIDVMQAISSFGAALKTTTQERSYPTLRGHPPTIKLTDEVSIPNSLKRPQTGITIEIPPTLNHVFSVVSLAYYLGAKVVPGSKPRLVTENGYSYLLNRKYDFERTVERVLKQIFFLDCIVQTEGETPSSLYERKVTESLLEFDIEELHTQSMVEQLETYLEISFDVIEPYVPTWYSKVCLKPTAEHVEFLPFIANDLAIVKIMNEEEGSASPVQHPQPSGGTPQNITSFTEYKYKGIDTGDLKHCLSGPVIQQHWKTSAGTDIASTKPLSAFQNSITQSPDDGPIRIEVVCNDNDMSDELVTVHSTYREESNVPFDVTVHHNLSTDDLRELLAKESDFLHYIGHIDSDGFRCSDGSLDAADLESVGTKTFFLNACQSYEQGLHLIQSGSLGGIVTLTEIRNQDAVHAGNMTAQLLNCGIPLYGTLSILRQISDSDPQYQLLGAGELVLSHLEIGPPIIVEVSKMNLSHNIRMFAFSGVKYKPGSVFTPYLSTADSYYLVPGELTFTNVSRPDLIEFFNKEKIPVLLEGELRWSNEIKTSEL